ncbi:MAG: response regulator [Candidatus Promineifilaceae bacterium]
MQNSDIEEEGTKKYQILAVEENHSDYRLLQRSLGRSNLPHSLVWASTVKEGLSLLESARFDIVLVAYGLPDMTGLEMIERMMALRYEVPIIFITAMGSEEIVIRAFQLGVQNYIVKDLAGQYLKLLPFVVQRTYQQWENGRVRQELELTLRKMNAALELRLDEQSKEFEAQKAIEKALEEERAALSVRVSRRTAELTKTNQELSKAMQSQDQFLANMSHELRTPLTAILGKAEVLLEEIYGPLTPKQLRAVEMIDQSSHHLLALINDILDVTRIEGGQLELESEMVALQSLCEASIQSIIGEAQKKGIAVNKQFDRRVQTIQADNRRLKQILVNLLSNAVKFTPQGGEIGLEVQSDLLNEIVKIVVWDTGIGISDEGKRELFGEMNRPKPFVQLENTLSREYPGTGLGLVLVYSLTEIHGGSLHIESEAGEGTRITVSLPIGGPNRPSNKLANFGSLTGQDEKRQSGTILLAEDNLLTVGGIVEFLSLFGFDVVVAGDGEQVVEKAAEFPPDLILMDIQLPKRDGLEAIKIIRNDLGLTDVPVIALTALTMPGDRQSCLDAGADEFISKPFKLGYLADVIRQLGVIQD